jgi:hypothetical protein
MGSFGIRAALVTLIPLGAIRLGHGYVSLCDQPARHRFTAIGPSLWMARYFCQNALSIFFNEAGVLGLR